VADGRADFAEESHVKGGAAQRAGPSGLTHCSRCAFELIDDAVEVGISGAEFSREPVSAASGNFFAVGEHVELTGFAGREDWVDVEPFLHEGRETRDLRRVVVSRGAMNYFDFHGDLQRCLTFR
jgi:hypothetical protein